MRKLCSAVVLYPDSRALPTKVGLVTIRHSARLIVQYYLMKAPYIINMDRDYDTNVCVQANGPLCRVKGEWKRGWHSFLSYLCCIVDISIPAHFSLSYKCSTRTNKKPS